MAARGRFRPLDFAGEAAPDRLLLPRRIHTAAPGGLNQDRNSGEDGDGPIPCRTCLGEALTFAGRAVLEQRRSVPVLPDRKYGHTADLLEMNH